VTGITIDRIARVQTDVVDAMTKTSASSTLSEQQQNELLAQGCAEACELLKDWLADSWWDRRVADVPLKEYVPTQKEFEKFLGPELKASLTRASQCGISIPESRVDSLVNEARQKVADTVRRFPRMRSPQLFSQAEERVRLLQKEVCRLASQIGSTAHPPPGPAWRRKARKALGKVPGVLLAIALAMASAGPHAVFQNAAEWGQAAVRSVEVITVHYLADRAEPSVDVAPSRPGLQLR
jgi:hypothetical protein